MYVNVIDRESLILTVNFPSEGMEDGEIQIAIERHEKGKALEIDFTKPDCSKTIFIMIIEDAQFGGVRLPS